jgi:thiamine biosynthesis lipoprotein
VKRAAARAASAILLLTALAACNRREEPEPAKADKPPAPASASATPSAAPSAATAATAVTGNAQVVSGRYAAMSTSIEFLIWTAREPEARLAMDAANAEIVRLEQLLTVWREDSEVSRINAAAGGDPVKVSAELIGILKGARAIHDASEGVFDVSFYGLKGLWRFDHQEAASIVPSDVDIAARLPLVDGSKIEIDEAKGTVRLAKKGMLINLGGIAKGYAVDRAVAVLEGKGFKDVVVRAGGDLRVRGRKGQEKWKVGIRDPRGADGEFFARAALEDAAFSTAGDYERAFIKDGVRYHHILDPRTGKPAVACRSVTILAPDALVADELDDAVFILGPEKGLALVAKYPGAGAVIVDHDNKVHVSENLKSVVEVLHPPTPGI